jgi:tetratricopeptide (TPR) repeat protein
LKTIKLYCIIIFSFGCLNSLSGINTDSLLQVANKTNDIEKEIEIYIQISNELLNKNLDSAMLFAERANNMIGKLESDTSASDVYVNLGNVYRARGNHALSLDYYFKAKRILEMTLEEEPSSIEVMQKLANTYSYIGVYYFYQLKYDQALGYYEESLKILEEIRRLDPDAFSMYDQVKLFNNMAGLYIRAMDYDRAIEYYKTALELNDNETEIVLAASLYNNLGICYMEKFEPDLAFHYFRKALEIRKDNGDKRGVAQCYNNIGKNYFYQGKFTQAKSYLKDAYILGREIGNKESVRISLQALTSLYDTLNMYEQAFRSMKELKAVSDSLYNTESLNRISQLELEYEFEKQLKIYNLELQRREALKEKQELIYFSIGGVLFFLLLTALLLIFLQRNKNKRLLLKKDKYELERKHFDLAKRKLEEEIEYKNRELTTNVMYLLKKNEMITNISEKLIKSQLDFKKENQKIIQDIINELKTDQNVDVWAEFEAHFTQVHTDFYKKLNEQFPNLTSNEKKLCAFLKLNMSTKDIASITYQSVKSISVARSRLRKKLNIESDDVNLANFLAKY